MNIPVQSRGRKARTDIILTVAAGSLERAVNRADLTEQESLMLDGLALQLQALADQIRTREAAYGRKAS